VTLNGTTVSGNKAVERGGGISGEESNLTLDRSRVHGNSATGANSVGGGISATQISLTLRDSSVSDNSSKQPPGGIYNNLSTVRLFSSRVVHNRPTNCSGSPTPVPGCDH
jgi:predicted outer membrane repeat protein